MSVRFVLFVFSITILTNACSFLDNDSYDPAYLVFDEAMLTTKSNEGDAVHDIRSVWVFADGNFIGVFPIPGKVPVIPTGKDVEILISAGVRENAEINSAIEYPFMNRVAKTLKLEEGKEYPVELNFSYRPEAKFDLVEGFESSFQFFTEDLDGNTETRFSSTTTDKVSGLKSGMVTLNNSNKDFEVSTQNFFNNNLNLKGSVFLEFDYKCEESLLVGTELDQGSFVVSQYKVILVSTDGWKRAYINLSNEISNLNTLKYRVIFGAGYQSTDGEDSEIYLDNIKLIHF